VAPSCPAPVRPAVEAEHREEAAPARLGPLCAPRGPLPEGGEERREEGIGAAAGAGTERREGGRWPGSLLCSGLALAAGGGKREAADPTAANRGGGSHGGGLLGDGLRGRTAVAAVSRRRGRRSPFLVVVGPALQGRRKETKARRIFAFRVASDAK